MAIEIEPYKGNKFKVAKTEELRKGKAIYFDYIPEEIKIDTADKEERNG